MCDFFSPHQHSYGNLSYSIPVPVKSSFSQYALFCLEIECELQLII